MKAVFQGLRSPREKMNGWVHLPRFIDKIRLHQKNQLPADYTANFCQGFDSYWLEASGVHKDPFLEFVRSGKSDDEIEMWIKSHVQKTSNEIEALNQKILNCGRNDNLSDRLKQRKAEASLQHRDEIQTFVDFIDADEGRL